MGDLRLNVSLLRRRVPNLTSAAREVGLRPATVSNLCTGKIPIGRAEVRTLAALASLAECSLDELILEGEGRDDRNGNQNIRLIRTISEGGTVGLVARPGMGQLVVLAEVLHRLKQVGYKTVLLKPDGDHPELQEIMADVDIHTTSINEIYQEMVKLGSTSEIAFAADRSHVLTGEIYDLQERLQAEKIDTVTTFLVDLKGEVVDEDLPYGPLETLWQFDADLAARYKFPAVNPIHSTSSVLEGAHLDQHHLSIQQRAQKLLRRYRELRSLAIVKGVENLPSSEIQTYKRGERLEAYLTQPFYVAEPFTGKKGETVGLQKTLNDVRKILEGGADSFEIDQLNFIGKI